MKRPGLALWLAIGAAVSGCQAESRAPAAAQQAAPQAAAEARGRAPSGLELAPLKVVSGGREHVFTVEVARSDEEQEKGLMFRERLGPNEGMIFPRVPPRPASFWMKNTLIPLDIIFVRGDGTIARIAANTVPHSLEPVGSGELIGAVLEIPGGRSAELGIQEGDRVVWGG